MNDVTYTAPHRTLGLHEWLALLVLLALCNGVHAATVYKCTGADGAIAYQSAECAASQRATSIELAPVRDAAPSPQYAVDSTRMTHLHPTRVAHSKTDMAYECRMSGGGVFYRLTHCPHSVSEKSDNHRGTGASKPVTVASRPVPRSLACSEMGRAGAIGRKGHEFDESISTYDRNVGNDPCK